VFVLHCTFDFAEDIDVQDITDAATDAAAAEDNTDVDILSNGQRSAAGAVELKSSPVQQKSGSMSKGPLKSIMKKREERAREKIQRKESDVATPSGLAAPKRGSHFKEFLELHVSKSPRHSVSMSSVVGATSGETLHGAVDVGAVQLTGVRVGSGASRASTDTETAPGRGSVRHSATTESPVDPPAAAVCDSSLQVNQENSFTDSSRPASDDNCTDVAAELIDNTQL